jgi:hypothetical protein
MIEATIMTTLPFNSIKWVQKAYDKISRYEINSGTKGLIIAS